MPSDAVNVAIPLLQASLVALTLWLGVARYILDRSDDTKHGEAGIVTAGAVFLVFSTITSSFVIARNAPNELLRKGFTAIGLMALLVFLAGIGMVSNSVDDSGLSFHIKYIGIAALTGLLTLLVYYLIAWMLTL